MEMSQKEELRCDNYVEGRVEIVVILLERATGFCTSLFNTSRAYYLPP